MRGVDRDHTIPRKIPVTKNQNSQPSTALCRVYAMGCLLSSTVQILQCYHMWVLVVLYSTSEPL